MNILYCGDKNIENGLILSVLSLLRQVREELCVEVLTVDAALQDHRIEPVSDAAISRLDAYVRERNPGGFVRKTDITDLFMNCLPTANMGTRFTPCCMLRLFSDLVEDLPDRVLYLDNDVICRRDFSDFYGQDLDETEIVGVLDHYGGWLFRQKFWKRDYLNSGVLLMNLKKIRETGLFRRCRETCRDEELFMPDQSALNRCATAKRIAPRRYNEQRRLHKDTVFQHFTTSFRAHPPWIVNVKPWQIERMHNELKLHEYDDLLKEFQAYLSMD